MMLECVCPVVQVMPTTNLQITAATHALIYVPPLRITSWITMCVFSAVRLASLQILPLDLGPVFLFAPLDCLAILFLESVFNIVLWDIGLKM